MARKKSREIGKRSSNAREKTKRKRALWSVKSKPKPKVTHRPGLPHLGAPEGFRSISMAQAMMEYAKPIMKYIEDNENGLDDAMQITTMPWNYTISVERGNEERSGGGDIQSPQKDP
jgi:hypothetical protein